MKRIAYLSLIVLVMPLLFVPSASAPPYGPIMDVLTFQVAKGPDPKHLAMTPPLTTADVWPSLSVPIDLWSSILEEQNGGPRQYDVELLDTAGYTVTQTLGYHVGCILWNIRDTATINSYYRSVSYWPLHDVEFRHALIHCYDQMGIVPAMHSYTATPVRSLVPPSQSKYYSPDAEAHPYNPGDPFTSPPGEHSTAGILKAAGYTFVDAGTIDTVDPADYWKCPDGSSLPNMKIFTPLMTVAPTSYQHGAEFVADLASVGLAATTRNGGRGLINEGYDFNEYLNLIYGTASSSGGLFDACMVFCGLDQIPDQLYSLLHSSQDTRLYWGRRNAPGVIDPTIDTLADEAKFNLDLDSVEDAAKEIQVKLYDPTLPNADNFALAYMCLYSRYYFNVYNPNLQGIINMYGYGSDNKWTFLNINWATLPRTVPGTTNTQVIWLLDEEPTTYNPLIATTKYDWENLAGAYDGLTIENPYNLYDIPWIASDWTITETVDGMNIDFTLRSDVEWQDGKPFTAYDVEWCLEFIRDHQVPRYAEAWESLVDVVVTDATHLKVVCDKLSLALFYDFSGLAALLPRHIWDRPWASNQEVLDYDPTGPYNVAPGYIAGPHPTPTNVMGTGPYVFQFYDAINMYSDMYRNQNYFMSWTDIANLMVVMFWQLGDADYNGVVDVADMTQVSFAFGAFEGQPRYNPSCNFVPDLPTNRIDMKDMRTCAYHLGCRKEY